MAQQTKVVLLLLLATAATAYVTDFNKIIQEAEEHRRNSQCSTCCPCGWVKYERRCFTYQASKMDWASAEKHCLDLGGHLTSIHSENEYQLIKALIRTHDPEENAAWIGLNGCQKKFNWFWSDGSRLTFTKWNPREPNFVNGECCVHIDRGGLKNWNDISCAHRYSFVCARSI
ncbi:lactose-binding lectin l-2-like isoform X1 [Clarias gariepinus]|uniref:lactose-binding lectin l-2-like isoform X1 n=1 Tax=Clarias gariepinus TaxID=13013 RepID=UPI00234C220F|nr:lactose-binding lectin l-2-like isoform X1 [Clarias gariepinus]